MKLQILVPHYNETAEEVRPLLDSIALQQNVDFGEIGVILCHDGEDIPDLDIAEGWDTADVSALPPYPFEIRQIRQEHLGVSAARNACLDAATAEYVMFCDADDMFCNVCGLWILFREMAIGFDSLVSVFIEETRLPETKEVTYINREMDSTFVHGKVHRRQYLLDQNIRWNDSLTIHEDSFFNILCQNLSENVKYCQTPFYLWKWRDASVCRHDPKYILKTYENMLDSNDALIDEFVRRGMREKAEYYTVMMTFDAYYTMNKPEWVNQENRTYREDTERHFGRWFQKHEKRWNAAPSTLKMQVSNGVRGRVIAEGMMMESVTIDGWLGKIREYK
jgi:glycosyltransferase involved in cell wall biosynthesis